MGTKGSLNIVEREGFPCPPRIIQKNNQFADFFPRNTELVWEGLMPLCTFLAVGINSI